MAGAVIYKYPLPTIRSKVQMPQGARVLSVQVQRNELVLWALCDPDAPKVERVFRAVMTGEPMMEHGHYIATVQLNGGDVVAHVFEVPGA
jgi:hypothetical protein